MSTRSFWFICALTLFCFNASAGLQKIRPCVLQVAVNPVDRITPPGTPKDYSDLGKNDPLDVSVDENGEIRVLVGRHFDLESTNANIGATIYHVGSGRTNVLTGGDFQLTGGYLKGSRALLVGYAAAGVWAGNGSNLALWKKRANQPGFSSGALSADKKSVYLGSSHGTLEIRQIGSPAKTTLQFPSKNSVNNILLTPNESLVVAATGNEIRVVRGGTLSAVRGLQIDKDLKKQLGLETKVDFGIYNDNALLSPSGRYLITTLGGRQTRGNRVIGDWQSAVLCYDITNGEVRNLSKDAYDQGYRSIDALNTFMDGDRQMGVFVATNHEANDRQLFVVPLDGGEARKENYRPRGMQYFDTLGYETNAISEDGRYIATPTTQGYVEIIDREHRIQTSVRFTRDSVKSISKLFFTKEGRELKLHIICYDGDVHSVKITPSIWRR